MSIYVTKAFLPSFDEYTAALKQVWDCGILTNQGPLVQKLEAEIQAYLDVDYFHYLGNGTIALQLALHSLGIDDGEVITTPFSYVATTSSILWQRCKPVFVDIEENNFTIDPAKIEAAITDKTKAIMAVHVFGYPCQHEALQSIADKHNIKLIYDAAHAFGVKYKGRSLLDYGDISTVSFHATKLFHTVEGGGCIVKDKDVSDRMELAKKFGHVGDEHFSLGLNAKQSEFHAAMGLVNFVHLPAIIEERKRIFDCYNKYLDQKLYRPTYNHNDVQYNYAYYPVLFDDEKTLLKVFDALGKEDIFPRRYFYPSLNTLPYVEKQSCPVSEDISRRIACLPLYVGLEDDVIQKISQLINQNI